MGDATDRVRAALGAVRDPDTEQSLTESGLLNDVTVNPDGDAIVRLTIRSPTAPKKQELAAAVERALAQVDGIRHTSIEWSVDPEGRKVTPDDVLPEVKNVILVMSGKGGVGKSTIAGNLALALNAMGASVGLLDADIHGPSVPTMFSTSGELMSDGVRILPCERFGIKLMSIGFLLEDEKVAVIWRGPMLHGALVQFLKDVAWGRLDYLLLDLPPGTGDIALTLSQRVRCNGAVIVTTPQKVALQDVFKTVSMNQKLGIPILGVVENQSFFTCDHGTRYELFGKGGGEQVAAMAGAPLLGQIPIQAQIRECGDAGKPVVLAAPNSPSARGFVAIAEALAERIAELNAERGSSVVTACDDQGRAHLPVLR
jgi:ATP-binding protein involved in chromosome partitioning